MKIVGTLGTYSGKLAGLIFSHNKGGAYVKQFKIPTNPQTPAQTAVRERLSQLSKNWGAVLTEAQRLSWKLFADTFPIVNTLGAAQNVTGIAMYNKVNGILLNAEEGIINDPPVDLEVSSSLTMDITAAVGATAVIDLTYTPVLSATEKLYISGVINVSPGINNVKALRRHMGLSALAEASPYSFPIPAVLGNLVTGKKTSLLVQRIDTVKGSLSPGVVVEAIAT